MSLTPVTQIHNNPGQALCYEYIVNIMNRHMVARNSRRRLLVLHFFLLLVNHANARPSIIKDRRHLTAIEELKRLVPPPDRHELGGEEVDDAAYARFLSVAGWDPAKAEPSLRSSLEWRKRIRPGALRPRHCSTLCRQHAWVALTKGQSKTISTIEEEGEDKINNNDNKNRRRPPLQLDPPYNCPPLQSWQTTRHGLPITYFRCWRWRPDEASADEGERHLAYHIHHLIRRAPRDVSRICVIFDMRGFEGWMLPYVRRSIDVLRRHYPGRAGAMCFINAPGYFTAVWKVISPWLDDEIRSKTFFAPKDVRDAERAINFLNKMNLKTGLI